MGKEIIMNRERNKGFLFITAFLFISSAVLYSQGNEALLQKRVDSIFAPWNSNNSPGCALGIIKEGKLVYKKGYGLANLEYDIPITPLSIFHLASISKQFTAFSIILLEQEGKLSVEDDIRKYLPEVPDFGKKITISHLIHHTSGLRDQWELLVMAGWRLDDVITKEHVLKMVANQKELNFNPGAEYLYCNTGYTLLAEIVSRVSGKSFKDFTKERIFDPLGMNNTHFHDDHKEIVKNRTYSYNPAGNNGFENAVLSYANAGATSLFSTVEDLAKWINNFDSYKVGGEKAVNRMFETGILNNGGKLNYAFGLTINKYRGAKIFDHSGADAGYRTYVCSFPDNNFSVIVLSNLGSVNPSELAMKIADIYLEEKLDKKVAKKEIVRKEIKLDPSTYTKYTGTYQTAIGMKLIVTAEGNRLIGEATGQGRVQLFAESETKFFATIVDVQVTFEELKEGKYNRLTLHQIGMNIPAQRIVLPEYSKKDFAEYEGNYYSEELGIAFLLVFEKNGLVVKHRKHDDVALSMNKKDNFAGNQWWCGKLVFERDTQNKISGFRLTGSRVRNLKFVKTN